MKKLISIFILLFTSTLSNAQISKVVDGFIAVTQEADTTKVAEVNYTDSISELKLQLMQMQLNEIQLLSQLDSSNNGTKNIERQRVMIDSLRNKTTGVPLVIEGDTLFVVYAKIGGLTAHERVAEAMERITEAGKKWKNSSDTLHILQLDDFSEIMMGEKILFSVTDNDAIWMNQSRLELTENIHLIIKTKISDIQSEYGLRQFIKRILYFILVLLAQYLLFRFTRYFFRRIKDRIIRLSTSKLRAVVVKDYEFLTKERQANILIFLALMARYAFTAFQLIITIPILFSIFPQTEKLALTIFSYIYKPIKSIFSDVVEYIPNIFTIAIIYFCVKYIIKGIKYLADEIESGKLRITGFYADWAQPTFNISKFLLYAFMIAMIYPYLPGSDTGVFQGISVFVGLIVSLGSTAVIGNIVAGLVITYMRPFKIGDRIKLNDTMGNVIEKTPFVTRIKTPKNEIITIPNSFILSSHTVNYSASAQNYGLIIHTSVTIGYDAPWRIVHELLIDAAKSTPGVSVAPEPFVLETELSDFYPVYQINAYIIDANQTAQIYSDLHQQIQDKFNAAGVEIMSPHYRAERDGSKSTVVPPSK